MKRRILHHIKIHEISGVDRPAQEGAQVVIMKRTDADRTGNLASRISRLRDALAAIIPVKKEHVMSNESYDALVTKETCGGRIPRHVAEQRIIHKFGSQPNAARILKNANAANDFQERVVEIAKRDGCSQTRAMATARREHPDAFASYQEI